MQITAGGLAVRLPGGGGQRGFALEEAVATEMGFSLLERE